MANEKMKQKQKVDSVFEASRKDAEKRVRELRLKEHKADADAKIAEQCDRYIEAQEKYGMDSPMTMLLGTLLDVVVPLQELANQLVTMADMMNTLGSTLDLIDISIENIFNVFDEGQKYGAFDRMKSRYKISVFKGNLNRRMKKILISVSGMQGLSETLKKALQNIAKKNAAKLKKTAKGKKSAATGEHISGRALELVNARRKELGAAVPEKDTATATDAAGAASAKDGKPGVDGLMP